MRVRAWPCHLLVSLQWGPVLGVRGCVPSSRRHALRGLRNLNRPRVSACVPWTPTSSPTCPHDFYHKNFEQSTDFVLIFFLFFLRTQFYIKQSWWKSCQFSVEILPKSFFSEINLVICECPVGSSNKIISKLVLKMTRREPSNFYFVSLLFRKLLRFSWWIGDYLVTNLKLRPLEALI